MLNSTCSAGCAGVCRCSSKFELCLTAGEVNTVIVPCPEDEKGCILDELISDTLIITCPCCNIEIAAFSDILDLSYCSSCKIEVDLVDASVFQSIRNTGCKPKFNFFVNGRLFLSGLVCIDWARYGV